ncbi:MAG: tRNA-dihydrouridine synthase [Thermoleophilia bacterium]|nr:tRNA-dihydrouridine synthase [Thermoleophilia bacterium]
MKKRMRGVVAERTGPAPAAPGRPEEWPLARPFRIGELEIPNRVVQAPLAGIANWPFRLQSQRHGAGMAVSEMVASMGVRHGNRRTLDMMAIDPRETVTGIQLFGADPAAMAHAAVVAQEAGARMVDINMGCPVHKVRKTGAGSSLLGDLPRAEAIVTAMARAVDIPVTVKMRRGLTPAEARPVEAARRFEAAGAAAIAFHPRAAEEEYRGVADHAITADVVAAVAIPVMASGDITTPGAAREVLERTGCAAVMIGRAALGDPWVFGAMATGRPSLRPGLPGVVEEIAAFAADARAVLGDRRAVHFMRKFYPWYLAGEDVPQREVAALLVIEDLDEALGRLRHLAGCAPLASARGLN